MAVNVNVVATPSRATVQTSVASATADTLILAANPNRKGASVYNDSTQVLYLLMGQGISSTSVYSVQLQPNGYFETPYGYVGLLKGNWAAANGNARVTEYI